MTSLEELINKTLEKVSLVESITVGLMGEYKFVSLEDSKEILYYKDGRYVSGGDIIIDKECQKLFGSKLHKYDVDEIKYRITCRTFKKREELDADINIINLKNGLYHIQEDILKEHTPDYLSINQKPIMYVKGAKPKLFGKFLKDVLFAQDIRTGVDIMGYTFQRDYSIERAFWLFGLGNNGKSVYGKVITAIHGADNISNVSLSDMLEDRFALSDLENKDANIDDELEAKPLKEVGNLKRILGNNRVRIQRKRQRAYHTTLYAKVICNANKIPDSNDTSDASYKRIVILVFPIQFEGKTDDPKLLSKLTKEEELSGIFNMCMIALRRILKNDNLYLSENTIDARRAKYERMSNPIKGFLEEATVLDSSISLGKKVLYGAYEEYCQKYHVPLKKYDPFCKELKNNCELQDVKVKVDKDRWERQWSGITLTVGYIPKTDKQKKLA